MNPVIPVYAADPHAELFGGRYYIYATNAGVYGAKEAFHSGQETGNGHGFAVWSSDDLQNWRDEGMILRFSDVDWAKELAHAWAPCAAERNGRYYFYFCADSRMGVAVSDSPTGPFADALGKPLVPYRDDLSAIDPMVFIDDDGQAYMYWGAVPGYWLKDIEYTRMHLSVRKLARDMISFEGEEMPTVFTQRSVAGWHDLDHIEASHVFKRNGIYYLMWSTGSFSSDDDARTYRVEYAMSESPLGPWHRAPNNPVLSSRRDIDVIGPGHHSTIQIPGTDEWWCVYHSHKGDVDRRVWIDRMTFAADGAVHPIVPTLEGPEVRQVRLSVKLAKTGPFAFGDEIEFCVESDGSKVELVTGGGVVGNPWRDAPRGFHRVFARSIDGYVSAPISFDVV